MKTISNNFVITLAVSIADNRIDNAIVEKVEIKSDDDQAFNPDTRNHEKADTHQPLTQKEKSESLDYIYADFNDGAGIHLVSVNDTRLLDFFTPCYKTGANIKPAMGPKLIHSSRQVRGYRISGYALVKSEN